MPTQAVHNNSEFQKKPQNVIELMRQMDLWLVETEVTAKKLVAINFAGIFGYASVVSETRFNPLRSAILKIRYNSTKIPPIWTTLLKARCYKLCLYHLINVRHINEWTRTLHLSHLNKLVNILFLLINHKRINYINTLKIYNNEIILQLKICNICDTFMQIHLLYFIIESYDTFREIEKTCLL